MARQAVTKRQLGKGIVGMAELLKEIEHRSFTVEEGTKIKALCKEAAKPIEDNAKRNIDSLDLSPRGKQILKAMVVRGEGPKKFPNAIVAMYQFSRAAKAFNPQGDTILNPYWIEFGTVERQTGKSGGPIRRTGRINIMSFFVPAVKDARPEVKMILATGLKSILIDGK